MRLPLATAALLALSGPALADGVTPLVAGDWLNDRLGADDLVVLDIRNAIDGGSAETFAQGHIPGSIHSDYLADGWRAPADGIVGMLPPIADLEALIGGLGIDNDDHVVIVPAGTSSTDFGSAARVYWTFKVLGHDAVSILDGGLAGWTGAGFDLASGTAALEPATFTADFQPQLIATADEVEAAIDSGVQLVDARPADQYAGEAAHAQSLRAGTIPGAVNLQQQTLLDDAGQRTVSADAVNYLLQAAGGDTAVDGGQIAFCNTGHWAAVAWFALSEVAGQDDVALYDGSMVDWTADQSRPVVNGTIN